MLKIVKRIKDIQSVLNSVHAIAISEILTETLSVKWCRF